MERIRKVALKFPSREDFRKCRATIARSSVIGTFIGILPAEGTTVAAIMGYKEAKRWSKNKDEFGKGAIEGIAGPDAATKAGTGSGMVRTLQLGFPCTGTTAPTLYRAVMRGFSPAALLN